MIILTAYINNCNQDEVESVIKEVFPKEWCISDPAFDYETENKYIKVFNAKENCHYFLEYYKSKTNKILVETNKNIEEIDLQNSLCLRLNTKEYNGVLYSVIENICKKFGGYLISLDSTPNNVYYTFIDKVNQNGTKINVECEESQYMSFMFDDLDSNIKFSIKDKISSTKLKIKDFCYDLSYGITNWIKWFKVISKLRPWEGFDGVLQVAKHHLKDYLNYEIHYGHTEDDYRQEKIHKIKRCLELIEKIQKDEYEIILMDAINQKYPKYYRMVSKTKTGVCYSGKFVKFKDGWVGIEGGNNPRKGYFILKDGKFVIANSPNEEESNLLLKQMIQYEKDIKNALQESKECRDKDLNELSAILKEGFFSFWD